MHIFYCSSIAQRRLLDRKKRNEKDPDPYPINIIRIMDTGPESVKAAAPKPVVCYLLINGAVNATTHGYGLNIKVSIYS